MKAVVYTQYGPPEVLQLADVPKPAPKANEILVKVHATAVTSTDPLFRSFTFPPLFWIPSRIMLGIRGPRHTILGETLAGQVEAVGADVTRFQPGDAVFGLNGTAFGAYAEYVCVAADGVVAEKPANLSYEEAAAATDGALTALIFLRDQGQIESGQKVLINGASGSVGTFAVQLARHYGAEVTGVCSTANVELVRSLGADHVVDYTQEDFTASGNTYDIIFDTVGKLSFARCKGALTPDGRYLLTMPRVSGLLQMIRTSITGGKKVIFAASSTSYSAENLTFLKDLMEAGTLKPVIDRSYPLEEIVEAHRYVETGHKKGNVVITVEHTG